MRHQISNRYPIPAQNNSLSLLFDRRHQPRKLRFGFIKICRNHKLKIKLDQTRSSLFFTHFLNRQISYRKPCPLEGDAPSVPIPPRPSAALSSDRGCLCPQNGLSRRVAPPKATPISVSTSKFGIFLLHAWLELRKTQFPKLRARRKPMSLDKIPPSIQRPSLLAEFVCPAESWETLQ